MRKNIFVAIFSAIFILFANTCYVEIPHIVTLHFAVDNDYYDLAGDKAPTGIYQIEVYPSQCLYDALDGKDPSQWDWSGVSKVWTKTVYGDYGFSTKNGQNMSQPYIYAFPWNDAVHFTVDHIQNTQTIGLFDEIYDVKDIYVPYQGPKIPVNVTFLFYQNDYMNGDDSDPDSLSGKKEIAITRSYLSGTPITDIPSEIIATNSRGKIESQWKESAPVTRYSADKYSVSDIKDFGYLEYLSDNPSSEDNGIYFSFLDNVYSGDDYTVPPSRKYSYTVTNDEANGIYKGMTYISNDSGYVLPKHDLIVRPQYTAPEEDVTYIYYDKYRTNQNSEYKKTTLRYRVGRRLKSPQRLKNDYNSGVYDELYWDSYKLTLTDYENFGYEDRTRLISATQKYPAFNFRANFEGDAPHYIFEETDYNGNTLANKDLVYSEDHVLKTMNIRPLYTEAGKMNIIFNFSTNTNFDSYDDNTIVIEEYSDPNYVFEYNIGKDELVKWEKSSPYAYDYPLGFGYRKYKKNDESTLGTMYYFNPKNEGRNNYRFKYKKLVNPLVYGPGRYEDAEINFGQNIDLDYYENAEEDRIVFTPVYETKDITFRFKHYTTNKVSEDVFRECTTDYSEITINQGEKFPYDTSQEIISDWVFNAASDQKPELVGWTEDADTESYGYVTDAGSGSSEDEGWYDFNMTKNIDNTSSYKFKIIEGKDVGEITDLSGYLFYDLTLLPVYTPDMVEVILQYYQTKGSSVNVDDPAQTVLVTRTAEVQRGYKLNINPLKFSNPDYLWFDSNIGDWTYDYDDYAHSLTLNEYDNYALDFTNELRYGYRDVDDNYHRYYFGEEPWYCDDYKSSFRFICQDDGNNTEVVFYTDEDDAARLDSDYRIRKKVTFRPKYIDAGYAAVPIYFVDTASESAIKSSNSNRVNRDNFVSRFSQGFVYIPGTNITGDKWPNTSVGDVIAHYDNPDNIAPYLPYAEYQNSEPYYPTDIANPDGKEVISADAPIRNILFGETPVSKRFFMYLLATYYKLALGRYAGTEIDNINFELSDFDEFKNDVLEPIRYYNDQIIEYATDRITESSFRALFPDARDEILDKSMLFYFHMNSLFGYDNIIYNSISTNSDWDATQGLSYYYKMDLPVRALSFADTLTLYNLMTYMYNLVNPSNTLTYVYLKSDGTPFTGSFKGPNFYRYSTFKRSPSTNFAPGSSSQAIIVGVDLFVNNANTGFRCPDYNETEYVEKIVLNELVLGVPCEPNEHFSGDNYYNWYTYSKKATAPAGSSEGKYYFKRGCAYSTEGLRQMNGMTLNDRIAHRERRFRDEVMSYNSPNSVSCSMFRFKKDLNNRNAANIFDMSGFLGFFYPIKMPNTTQTNSNFMVMTNLHYGNPYNAPGQTYWTFQNDLIRFSQFTMRVCRTL